MDELILTKLKELQEGPLEASGEAIQYFDELLADTDSVEEELVHSLIQSLGHRIWIIRSRLYSLFLRHQNKIYPFLSEYLNDKNEDIQYWSIQIYCSVAQDYYQFAQESQDEAKSKKYMKFVERNVKRLTNVFPDVTEANQIIILSGLGKIRYQRLIPFFSNKLNSKKWVLRHESAKALGNLGEIAVPHLKKLILEGTRDQCYWSFRVLGQLLGEKALEPFFRVVNSPDYADEIRIYALSGMKQIETTGIIPYLMRCLSSDLWVLRAQASETLINMKGEVVNALIECLNSREHNLRFWALKTLAEVVHEEDLPQIEGFIREKDQELRFYTITALSRIASPRAIRLITDCFNDEAWLIRKHAADSLVMIGEKVIQPLVTILKEYSDDEEKIFWTLQVFSTLRVKSVLPALSQFLRSENRDYRLYAVRAIAQIQGEEAVRSLIEGFSNDLWVVRHECFMELRRKEGCLPLVYGLGYLNHPNDSIHYWVTKYLRESEKEGLISLIEEMERLENDEVRRLAQNLESLQEQYLEELLNSPLTNLERIKECLTDPFKLKERAQIAASIASKPAPVASPVPIVEVPVAAVSEHHNYFYFDQDDFERYEFTLDEILEKLVFLGGSDLHLKADEEPMVRVHGAIQSLGLRPISSNQIKELLRLRMDATQQRRFCANKQLDFSLCISSGERFRVNVYLSHKGIEGAFRHIKKEIPGFEDLGLPVHLMEEISRLDSGLVLITGVTGAGKSSTLASIIGAINKRDSKHILCIEDPIEYIHTNQKSVISHRQLGEHVDSFVDGLKAALREDPDVVLVGEMRDVETIKSTLKLAGTGHLVFSTFHTESAPQTIEQLIQFFPPDERQNICAQLSFCLRGVVSQILVPDFQSLGRVPVLEMMRGTNAVKNMIRDGKTEQLYSVMQTGSTEGMMTRDQHLKQLAKSRKIRQETMELYLRDKKQGL